MVVRVGSFATTTSMVRFFKMMPDEKIPGSLNVGYVLPTMIQAYVTIHGLSGLGVTVPPVEVDPTTLILMIVAAIVGAWLGAGVVAALGGHEGPLVPFDPPDANGG